MDSWRVGHVYQTSIDRAGLAIAAGGATCGVLALLLVLAGGQNDPLTLVLALPLGSLLSAMAITAVGVPLWLPMHLSGRRRAHHAVLLGAVIGFIVFVAAQTHGFGLGDTPVTDHATTLVRWISAIATSLGLALISGLVGLVMWRVAYRRAG